MATAAFGIPRTKRENTDKSRFANGIKRKNIGDGRARCSSLVYPRDKYIALLSIAIYISSRRGYPRGNPVSTIHIVRIIDVLLSTAGCHRDSHRGPLNAMERLIGCCKVETSSTHSWIFTQYYVCMCFFIVAREALFRKERVVLFHGSITSSFFFLFLPVPFSLFYYRSLYIPCSLPLYYPHQAREIDEILELLSQVLTLLRLRWKVTSTDPSV